MRISDCSSDVCSSYLNHAGAQHFHPSFRPANDALPLLHRITDIDLHRRFSEGEITGPQTKNDVVTLKKCLQKGSQRPFEMDQLDAFVDAKIGSASCREKLFLYV